MDIKFLLRNVMVMVLLFSLPLLLIACGGDDNSPDNNGANEVGENSIENIENNPNAAEVGKGIDLPDIVIDDENVISDFRGIIDHITKMDVEWDYEPFEGEGDSFKLSYEWLGEREVDGELVDHIQLTFEDVGKNNFLGGEFDYKKNGGFATFDVEYTGEQLDESLDSGAYFLTTVESQWVHLFQFFNNYRIMLNDDQMLLSSYDTETSSVGGNNTTVHLLETGESLTFAGSYYSNDKIELAVFDDFELLLNIEKEDRPLLEVNIMTLDIR